MSTSLRVGHVGTRLVLARAAWDADLDDGVASPVGTGIHVTSEQVARRGRLKERFLAGSVGMGNRTALSASFTSSTFSEPAVFDEVPLRNLMGYSISAMAVRRGQRVFAEVARSLDDTPSQAGHAWLVGTDLIHDAFRLTAAARHYGQHFLTLRGTPITAYSGSTDDEIGWFVGWQVVWVGAPDSRSTSIATFAGLRPCRYVAAAGVLKQRTGADPSRCARPFHRGTTLGAKPGTGSVDSSECRSPDPAIHGLDCGWTRSARIARIDVNADSGVESNGNALLHAEGFPSGITTTAFTDLTRASMRSDRT